MRSRLTNRVPNPIDQLLLVLQRLPPDAEPEQRRPRRQPSLRIDRRNLPKVVRGDLAQRRTDATRVRTVFSVLVKPPPVTKSDSAGPGQTSAALQLAFAPEKPPVSSARRLKSAIHRIVAGSVRSGALTRTSSSPDTPVTSCSSFSSSTAWTFCGASSRMSVSTLICVPTPQPMAARISPAASTLSGCACPIPRRRCTRGGSEGCPCRARRPVFRPTRSARENHRKAKNPARNGAPLASAPDRRLNAAKPPTKASAKAMAIPATRSRPKLRTIGVGDSWRARNPAAVARQAVAMTGPPPEAAKRAASAPEPAPRAIASSYRACS